MENHSRHPIVKLKVISGCCCEKCIKKLEKKLSNVDGVYKVAIELEKKRVSVIGNVHPGLLLKIFAKMKKDAEIVFYDKEPENENSHTEDHGIPQNCRDNPPTGDNSRTGGQEKVPDENLCQENDPRRREDFVHKDKQHVPPKETDEESCEDPFCHVHGKCSSTNRCVPPRNCEDKKFSNVPHTDSYFQKECSSSRNNDNIFHNHPDDHYRSSDFRSASARYDTRTRHPSRWFEKFMEEPPPYDHYRQRMPPPTYAPFRQRHISQYNTFWRHFQ